MWAPPIWREEISDFWKNDIRRAMVRSSVHAKEILTSVDFASFATWLCFVLWEYANKEPQAPLVIHCLLYVLLQSLAMPSVQHAPVQNANCRHHPTLLAAILRNSPILLFTDNTVALHKEWNPTCIFYGLMLLWFCFPRKLYFCSFITRWNIKNLTLVS